MSSACFLDCLVMNWRLLAEPGFSQLIATLHIDNTDAIQIATNPMFHERTKRIEVDCHYIGEAYDGMTITTNLPVAAISGKALPCVKH